MPGAAGKYAAAGQRACVACPSGQYSTGGASLGCTACPAGRYGAAPGQSSPTCQGPCTATAGRYCAAQSTQATGLPCPAGSYSVAGSSSASCMPCESWSSFATQLAQRTRRLPGVSRQMQCPNLVRGRTCCAHAVVAVTVVPDSWQAQRGPWGGEPAGHRLRSATGHAQLARAWRALPDCPRCVPRAWSVSNVPML